jgi:hypothetical protein
LNLASALARSGDLDRACRELRKALDLAPELRPLLPGFSEFGPLLRHPELQS